MLPTAFQKPSIFDFDTYTCNGLPIQILQDDVDSQYKQPPGVKATCHLHKEPQGFKSIEELQQHELKGHRVWKG